MLSLVGSYTHLDQNPVLTVKDLKNRGQEVAAHCYGHCHGLSSIMTQENSQEIGVTQTYDRKQTNPLIHP